MESKIVFLGTGGDIFVVGKQIRASGGIILDLEDMQFHLDPGPGSLNMAKELDINPRNTLAVFVSSPDINLCNDVNAVIDAMTHHGLDKKGVLVACNSVYNGNETMNPFITRFHRNCPEKSIAVGSDKKVGINEVEIRTLPTFDRDDGSIGLKFSTSKFNLTYSSCTGYSEELIPYYEGSQILILNVLSPGENSTKGNLCSRDAIEIAKKVKPRMLIITGFGIKMIKTDILAEARYIQHESGVQTIAAKDGLVVNPFSYNVTMKQKTLRNF